MPTNGRKNGTGSVLVDRALNAGLLQAAEGGGEVEAQLKLNASQEKMVAQLCTVLGLSARAVFNAALRYTLYTSRIRKVAPAALKEFPRRLNGRLVKFLLTAETLSQLRQAGMLEHLAGCAVAGIRLLYERTLKVEREG